MTRQRNAIVLGVAGLVPFWGFAIGAAMVQAPELHASLRYGSVVWSAVILSFLSGTRWAMVLGTEVASDQRLTFFGALPAISLAALFLPPAWGLPVLVGVYGLLLASELTRRSKAEAPLWYPRLRIGLSAAAIAAMVLAWASV